MEAHSSRMSRLIDIRVGANEDFSNGSMMNPELYEQRFSHIFNRGPEVVFRGTSRDRIDQTSKNRQVAIFKDMESSAHEEDIIRRQPDNLGGRPTTPLTTFGEPSRPSASPSLRRAGGEAHASHDDCPEDRPLLEYASGPLPEVVLCSRDAVSQQSQRCPNSRDEVSQQSPGLGSPVLGSPVLGSPSQRPRTASLDDLLLTNNVSFDSSDDAINEKTNLSCRRQPHIANITYNIAPEPVMEEKISNLQHPPQLSPTTPSVSIPFLSKKITDADAQLVQCDNKKFAHDGVDHSGSALLGLNPDNLNSFVLPKIRNGRALRKGRTKGDPENTKEGNPRSRRPIIKGDYGRVSDLSFISTNGDLEESDLDHNQDESDELNTLTLPDFDNDALSSLTGR